MIKANDLRIGNFFIYSNKIGKIASITLYNLSVATLDNRHTVTSISFEDIEPIPLTEEWLTNFGFEKINKSDYFLNEFSVTYNNTIGYGYYFYIKGVFLVSLKCIHQLQNLYWCLCGKELTILEGTETVGTPKN